MSHVTSKKVIQIVLAVLAIGFLAMMFASCSSNKGLCSGPPSIGNQSTKQVMKYYKKH